jgi:hypothetical protein
MGLALPGTGFECHLLMSSFLLWHSYIITGTAMRHKNHGKKILRHTFYIILNSVRATFKASLKLLGQGLPENVAQVKLLYGKTSSNDLVAMPLSNALSGNQSITKPGVYILENSPPPWGGKKYQPMSFGGKNMKR